MGAQLSQVQSPQTGKTGPSGNTVTIPATSAQPSMGQPNQNMYPNTVGQWDNASIQPTKPRIGGKGKG